ncbi:MAG: bifunctional UDP-N-acetylglucosamine diphosphorylase/glucosamine-1-phosphate N-acetyltransferase GlmU, partial [Burkholderiales bacterium]|nr:bifunctional UDP-N-acetylglucosamine diphosphorylase/glucosamine-1-phosphate N-acetyltransferase GlmU [Burkholderiales bacterium]
MSRARAAIILAAGQGVRMRSALPKVLHPLAGKPLLRHVLDAATAVSASRLVVVYGHGGDAVLRSFNDPGIHFVVQEPQLGTGHALQQALPHLPADGATLVLYGDVPLIRPETLARVLAHGNALCLLTAVLDDPTGYGRIIRDSAGKVVRIVEEKDADAAQKQVREINTGIIAAPNAALREWLARLTNHNAQREYYLTDVVPMAIAAGMPVVTETVDAAWEIQGVNSREQLAELERRHQLECARRLMADGVTLLDPARFDQRGTLQCGQDVTIDIGCVFEGQVIIGEGCHIGAHCVIKDCEIGSGTVIAPFSHLQGAHIGCDCRIGPYARLRPGAALAAHAHVGNFVEMKNASLGEGSKANHLTYLGDAVVGKDVNIGAGTITCNYDGANKSRTVIEDGAFIGSNSALVAPVTIGRDATIGAGSTITADAPAG